MYCKAKKKEIIYWRRKGQIKEYGHFIVCKVLHGVLDPKVHYNGFQKTKR